MVTFTFSDKQVNLRHPKLWLPPAECLVKLTTLINCKISYLFKAGQHNAKLPDFTSACLGNEDMAYDLGPTAYSKSLDQLLSIDENEMGKRKKEAAGNKRGLESTPKKQKNKRKASFPTPQKIR